LKALHLALTGLHPYTHDLVELLDTLKDLDLEPPQDDLVELLDTLKDLDLEPPQDLYLYADALTPHYTMSRYPGRKPLTYNKGLAERCIGYARRIIEWVKEQASKV